MTSVNIQYAEVHAGGWMKSAHTGLKQRKAFQFVGCKQPTIKCSIQLSI